MESVVGDLKSNNRLTALLVEDCELIRPIQIMFLNSAGVDVVEAENGKIAVDICKSGKVFDFILMDKEMPIMNGIEATKALRGMGVSCLIVGVTAESEENELQNFKKAGLDICYEKPLSSEKLQAILQKIKIH